MREDNPLLAPSSASGSEKRTTMRFGTSQMRVSWTVVLFCAITCLFFILFFELTVCTNRAANIFAYLIAFLAYIGLAAVSIWILIWFSVNEESSNYQRSAAWIFVLCIVRGTEYMTMIVISTDSAVLEGIEALTGSWGFFFGLAVVNAIVREYFGDAMEEPEPVSRLTYTSNEKRSPISSHHQSKGFVFSRAPDRGINREEAQKVHERIRMNPFIESSPKTSFMSTNETYLKAIFGCCIVMTILVFLPPANSWVVALVRVSTGVTVALGFLLIRLLILEVGATSNTDGYFLFAKTHSNGLVVMAFLIAMTSRIVLDGLELLSGVDLLHYQPNINATGFLNFAKETTTEVYPLVLHFFNIICMRYDRTSDTPLRVKWLVYALLLHLHLVTVAYIVETTESASFGVLLASTSGYLAALDTALFVLVILSPLLHLFLPVFNFGIIREGIHNLHLHRRLAYSACFFAGAHAIVHLITWAARPGTTIGEEKLYSFSTPYLYTGIIMIVGYVGAMVSGRNPNSQFAYHLPFSIVAIFGFSVHGSGAVLGQPTGDYMVLGSALISAILMILFFSLHPTRRAEIDLTRSVCVRGVASEGLRSFFLLLVLDNPTRQPVPPGSLFNIYDKRGGGYPFIHAHPFPVLSSSPKRLVFFIRCRDRKNRQRPSFTRVLYKNVNSGVYKHLQLQGPFCGSSTVSASFIQYLVGLPTKTDVYLTGVDGGFAGVFSLLEYLKGNCHMHNIRAIFCVYHITEEKMRQHIHEYVDELIETWNSIGEVPITIVETPDMLEALQIFSADAQTILATATRTEGENVILDILREKFDRTSPQTGENSEEPHVEIAKWVAVGQEAAEKRVNANGWEEGEGVGWEEIDGEGVRKKGKRREKRKEEETHVTISAQPNKALYSCGIEVDYKFFSENWKIFNELTSPSYKLRNYTPEVDHTPQPSYQPGNLYQTSVNSQ